MKNNTNYQKIITKIQKIRSKNNINWMDILRLAFKNDPKGASQILRKINSDDKKISSLVKELSK
jgi:hypothetical protein